ncbi:heparinase [Opitutaceae bacterium TAV4]|nr:heparinase [Opitutaceae bacterium TAV4]RRK00296.1 heparinase [Opitutaceae bacterium TAV3]
MQVSRHPTSQSRRWLVCSVAIFASLTGLLCSASLLVSHEAATEVSSARVTLVRIAAAPELAEARETFFQLAREEAAKPLVRRPRTLAELLAGRTIVKYRNQPTHMSRLTQEQFEQTALSIGDADAARHLATHLPRMAAAAALTGDAGLAGRVREQLREMTTWSPLQRPGWSVNNSNPRLPEGGDGPWLGTGWAVRAMADAMALLPPDELPDDLRLSVIARFDAEISSIMADWQTTRNWYLRRQAAFSNQWALPIEGLIRASLVAGLDRHRDAYEYGIKQMLRSLDAQGPQGEFIEGLHYANITLGAMLSTAQATSLAGDERIRSHPFLKSYPVWFAGHLQPGGFYINAFDTNTGNSGIDRGMLSQFIVVMQDPIATWVLATRSGGGFADTFEGLAARTVSVTPQKPPLWAKYEVATRINWRSSWDDDTATGFWMRGGYAGDDHDHMDRGHINFIIGKRPLLIEAGLLSYGIAEHRTHFRSVAGHNVLQVGNAPAAQLTAQLLKQKAGQILDAEHRSAPITVKCMDASGGEASVDVSGCYASVKRWVRHVTWNESHVDVRDEVELREPDHILFRWHLGQDSTANQVPTRNTTSTGNMRVGDIVVSYEADTPVNVTVEPMPDRTLRYTKSYHACVVIASGSTGSSFCTAHSCGDGIGSG